MILNVKFSELSRKFGITFSSISKTFDANFGEVQTVTKYIGGDPYEGDYIVTPRVVEQTMSTKDKVMTDDVTIKSIPFFNVSNESGGSTVYIAKEI